MLLYCKSQDFAKQTVYDYQLIPFESKTIYAWLAEKTSFLKPTLERYCNGCKVSLGIKWLAGYGRIGARVAVLFTLRSKKGRLIAVVVKA